MTSCCLQRLGRAFSNNVRTHCLGSCSALWKLFMPTEMGPITAIPIFVRIGASIFYRMQSALARVVMLCQQNSLCALEGL